MRIAQLAQRGFYAENTTGASTVGWANIETISDEAFRVPDYPRVDTGEVMVIIWSEQPSAIRVKYLQKDYPLRAGMNIVYVPERDWGVLSSAGKFQLAAIPL